MLVVKNLLFTVIVPGTVGVYLPLLIAAPRAPARGLGLALPIALLLVGAGIYSWCIWDFASYGRGTPAPIDAPKRLVVRGLYRYCRNPMYVGVLTTIVGWAALFQQAGLLAYACVVGLCFHLFVVLYEEPHLQRTFGTSYQEYRAQVGRWLPRSGGSTTG